MLKKVSLTVVLLIGVVWVIAPFAFNLWGKGPAVDHLTTALKPAFSNSGVAQEKSDAKTLNAFITDLNTTTVPLLAKLTGKSDADVVALVGTTFPTVGKLFATNNDAGKPFADGKTYLQHSAGYVATVADTFGAQQKNFQNAQQIPTKSLPTVAVAWLFAILGLLVLALASLFIWKPESSRVVGAAVLVVGFIVIAVTYAINVPGKTQSVDNLTNAFRPVFSTSGPLSIDQGQQYLKSVRAADETLEAKLVPTLSSLLKLTPAEVTSALTKTSPVVSAALFSKAPDNPQVSVLGGILNRWDGIATTAIDQRPNFSQADNLPGWGMPTTMVQFLLAAPGALLIAAVGGLVAGTRARRQQRDGAARRQTAGVGA